MVLNQNLLSAVVTLILLALFEQSSLANESRSHLASVPKPDQIREFQIQENDTLIYTLKLALDAKGNPQYFFRNIFTPVCYTNECKPVHVNFYWDLLGNYMKYEMPLGKILTKVDHDEFKEADYQKLRDILSRSGSIFADLKMEDLITKGTDSLSENVDAKTGATLKAIKNEVIDGAVYTCFTLWHIAYGKQVMAEMKKITTSYKTNELLHSFLSSPNHNYQYWAMEQIINPVGKINKAFEKDIKQVIRGKNVFTARAALQKLNGDFFAGQPRQNWLWETYETANYPMQVAILKKMSSISMESDLLTKLASSASGPNAEQSKLKLDALMAQKSLPPSVLKTFAAQLTSEDTRYAASIFKMLEYLAPKDRLIESKMNEYKKQNP
jgi:hypothetical protein